MIRIFILSIALLFNTSFAYAEMQIPAANTVTMIDLGAKSCIPCKMMAPILEKLEKEYKGRADVIFIDVWENPAAKEKYKIEAIPTQIFYNKKGEEVSRHRGFLDEKSIRTTIDTLLAE